MGVYDMFCIIKESYLVEVNPLGSPHFLPKLAGTLLRKSSSQRDRPMELYSSVDASRRDAFNGMSHARLAISERPHSPADYALQGR